MDNANEAARNQGAKISRTDVERMNPIMLLLDKKKDLQLSDSQTTQLEALRDSSNAKNATMLGSIDSLVYATRGATPTTTQFGGGGRRGSSSMSQSGASVTESESDDVRSARRSLADVVKAIRDGYAQSAQTALTILTPDQQAKAKSLLDKQRSDADKKVRNGLGGRG